MRSLNPMARVKSGARRASSVASLQSDWSMVLIGLYVFTFAVVTFKFPVAEIGIVVAVVGLFLQPEGIRAPAVFWWYAAFVLWAFIASFASLFPEVARDQVIERVKQVIILLVVVNALRTEKQIKTFALFFMLCFLLFPIRGAFVNYAVGENVMGRMIWNYIYGNPNDLAALCLLALGVALSVAFAKSNQKFVQIGSRVIAALVVAVIFFTQSRGAFLGLLFCMGPVLIWKMASRGRVLVYALAGAIALFLLLPASVWERFSGIRQLTSTATIAQADPEGSADERWRIQKVGWRIFLDHPIVGTGLGTYRVINNMYAPELGRRDTHNTYLNLAAEVGLPGLILWCAYFFTTLFGSMKMRRTREPGPASIQQVWIERALASLLVAGIFGSYAALTMPALILGLLWSSSTGLAAAHSTAEGNKALGGR